MKSLIVSLFTLISFKALAFSNDLVLKAGLNYTSAKINANSNSWDDFKGVGFNTHFGYRWEKLELNLSSYIYWGGVENVSFSAGNSTVTGKANFRHVSFSPMVKYTYFDLEPAQGWFLYTAIGPSWSLQTITMDEFQSTGSFNKDQKITYESFGGTLAIGIEEQMPFKEQHPVYLEFVYSFGRSQSVALVDASDFTKINILSLEEAHQKISGHFFMISMGITIF